MLLFEMMPMNLKMYVRSVMIYRGLMQRMAIHDAAAMVNLSNQV